MRPLRAAVVDDEPLAVRRMVRLLTDTGRVQVMLQESDPQAAIAALNRMEIDVVFLDIDMPGCTGFDLLQQITTRPFVVFTTAYDRFALRAFEVNSVDYLLKPVAADGLERALQKLERIMQGAEAVPDWKKLMAAVADRTAYPDRLPSRVGERIELVELSGVTHFFAQDKLTYAAGGGRNFVVDQSINELESRLDPAVWMRIHRSTLVNLTQIAELHGWFSNRMVVRLKDAKATELMVSRERTAALKKRLGI